MAPGGAAVSVKMTTPQKAPTVITAGGMPAAKPAAPLTNTTPAATPPNRVTVVSQVRWSSLGPFYAPLAEPCFNLLSPCSSRQEMQENVKKCKNFLATLIKLASHNSPSPDTSKNVKALVQDLLVRLSPHHASLSLAEISGLISVKLDFSVSLSLGC